MLVKKTQNQDNIATKILTHVRDYGAANERGQIFDRVFNRGDVVQQVRASRNVVGQGVSQMMYPEGSAPDGFSTFIPSLGVSSARLDPDKVQNAIAENQVQLYWRKNVERARKYDTVSSRSEVNESLIQICNEAIYKDDIDEICSLEIDHDANIGDPVRDKLCRIFRQTVLRHIVITIR